MHNSTDVNFPIFNFAFCLSLEDFNLAAIMQAILTLSRSPSLMVSFFVLSFYLLSNLISETFKYEKTWLKNHMRKNKIWSK